MYYTRGYIIYTSSLETNDEHVDTAENLDIAMPMYNLREYSDNYQDSSATLYQYNKMNHQMITLLLT